MRIYIAGAITNNPDYKKDFEKAEIRLYKRFGGNVEIFNPARISGELPELEHGEYMKFSFLEIDLSDMVYFLRGWEQSCGASQEYGYCIAKNKKIMFEE